MVLRVKDGGDMKIMFVGLVLVGLAGCVTVGGKAVSHKGVEAQSLSKTIEKDIKLDYLLYLPDGYEEADKDWPMILYLHGAGERGNNIKKIGKHGPMMHIKKEGKQYPFIVVAPQCPKEEWWCDVRLVECLDELLKKITSDYRVDEDRIYLTGVSMGGYGTWNLATEFPHRFAAIAPFCGAGLPNKARHRIRHLPVWVFHGDQDKAVPIQLSKDMFDALKPVSAEINFTVYPGVGHVCWKEAYAGTELYEWFLKHKRTKR